MRARTTLLIQIVICAGLIAGAIELWEHRAQFLAAASLAPAGGDASEAAAQTDPAAKGAPVIVAAVDEQADNLVLETVGTGRARRSISLRAEAEGKIVSMALAAGRRFDEGEEMLALENTDQRLALELAEAQLAEAGRVLDRLEALEIRAITSEARLTEVSTAQEIARIERDQAAEALGDRVLRAPFAGVSGLPTVEIGDRIDTETVIASFDDRSEILVGFDLPEAYAGRLEPGGYVSARTPAYPDQRFDGRVDAIDSRVDPVSRSLRVRVALPNAADRLRPGASFVVRIELPGDRYPVVPELALQFSREGPFVWTVRGGQAERVPVSLIRRRAGEVLVDGPLEPGEAVVVEGVQRLREGREVEVINADTAQLAKSEDPAAPQRAQP